MDAEFLAKLVEQHRENTLLTSVFFLVLAYNLTGSH